MCNFFQRHRLRLEVEFHNLGLKLRGRKGARVLAGVTGQLKAARLTAIMGPSGAGKTSLLCALAGKASYGRVTGKVYINGSLDQLDRYKKVMGYVPQDDIMHGDMTVEELLLFSARMRLPAAARAADHARHVERAIKVLQLEDVRGQVVGQDGSRGISGGQRKRVNLGLELVAAPALLLLDEPTSGLDSTASRLVMAAMQRIAHLGVTVAAVIHQPGAQLFAGLDDLLLLGRGGRTVFYGGQAGVQPYFESIGFQLPERANPADEYMDIITGLVTPFTSTGTRDGPADLPSLWAAHTAAQCCTDGGIDPLASDEDASPGSSARSPRTSSWSSGGGATAEGSLGNTARRWGAAAADTIADRADDARQLLQQVRGKLTARRDEMNPATSEPLLPHVAAPISLHHAKMVAAAQRTLPGFRRQFGWCLGRAVTRRVREPLAVFTDYAIFALTGMALGSISDRGRGSLGHFTVEMDYSNIAVALLATVAGLRTFSAGRLVFYREAASGLNRLAHFMALDTFGHIGTCVRSLLYLVMYAAFAQPRAALWRMYLVTVCLAYCTTGVAYFLSQVMEPGPSQLAAAVVALVSTLVARSRNSGGLLWLAWQASFAHWALEAAVIAEAERLTGVWLLARCADLEGLGYSVNAFWGCLGVLLGLGAFWRAMAAAAMLTLHRDKCR